MQFTYRFSVIVGTAITLLLLFHGFWPANDEEDAETKILRHVVLLETNVKEYEAAVSSLRRDIVMFKEAQILGRENADKIHEVSNPPRMLEKLFSLKRLKISSIYDSLPHLLDYEEALTPALTLGKDREGVSVVIGIPTVKRPTQSYLLPTLRNLLGSMLPGEKNDTLIIVFIAESDVSFVENTVNSIIRQFKKDVDSGLVEIIAPSASFYPNLKSMKSTLGDSDERTRWRTKQNLDYAYLMMYARHRGSYYVQLEDDVLSRKGFINTMKTFALTTTVSGDEWFMLDFCQLGFIGKLFRSSDLWKLVEFILLFYQDKPGDWLLSHFFSVKYCKLDYNHKRCLRELNKHWIHYKPSLFQHIGMISSLNGKVQKLKDRQFGKLELFTRHPDNPEAKVETTIKHYGRFSVEKAYKGLNFFWGLAPQEGDTIKFSFSKPLNLKSYRFVSGNAEHPSDKIRNASLEVKSMARNANQEGFSRTIDGFYLIDEFDDMGVLEGRFPSELYPISAVRITLKHASDYWVILSEIYIEVEKPT